jgi:hypothetical protein
VHSRSADFGVGGWRQIVVKNLFSTLIRSWQRLWLNKKRNATCDLELGWERAMRQFNVGEVVTFIPDWILRSAAPGDYKIVSSMPDRDGDHMYRIKSPLEEHERVVRENLLVKSGGYLPDEVVRLSDEIVRQSSHRKSITLPTLTSLEVHVHLEPITSISS